jgi:hypothetical protein
VTEREPTPVFRRFPWVQLVFCLACLSMAAWTWMGYSYAWPTTPEAVVLHMPIDAFGERRADRHPWLDEYVDIRGEIFRSEHPEGGCFWGLPSPVKDEPGKYMAAGAGSYPLATYVELYFDSDRAPAHGRVGVWRGRLMPERGGWTWLAVDTTASRLHPASVAGLVVGGMGCFIFGLYLRRWLRARKALARQPGRDMIA